MFIDDHAKIQNAANLLRGCLEGNIGNEHLKEAERLANELQSPETATPDQCWGLIWDKPLYANTRVEAGRRNIKRLSPFLISNDWRQWGLNEETVQITHLGGSNARRNFVISGKLAAEIEGLNIALHRLLAIQGGAVLLRTFVNTNPAAPFKQFVDLERSGMVELIRAHAGRGWGAITALHLLTDFGLAVKPDVHLVRSVNALGLHTDINNQRVPNLAEALKINDTVDNLGRILFKNEYGRNKRRYLDNALMEISRHGILAKYLGSNTH